MTDTDPYKITKKIIEISASIDWNARKGNIEQTKTSINNMKKELKALTNFFNTHEIIP